MANLATSFTKMQFTWVPDLALLVCAAIGWAVTSYLLRRWYTREVSRPQLSKAKEFEVTSSPSGDESSKKGKKKGRKLKKTDDAGNATEDVDAPEAFPEPEEFMPSSAVEEEADATNICSQNSEERRLPGGGRARRARARAAKKSQTLSAEEEETMGEAAEEEAEQKEDDEEEGQEREVSEEIETVAAELETSEDVLPDDQLAAPVELEQQEQEETEQKQEETIPEVQNDEIPQQEEAIPQEQELESEEPTQGEQQHSEHEAEVEAVEAPSGGFKYRESPAGKAKSRKAKGKKKQIDLEEPAETRTTDEVEVTAFTEEPEQMDNDKITEEDNSKVQETQEATELREPTPQPMIDSGVDEPEVAKSVAEEPAPTLPIRPLTPVEKDMLKIEKKLRKVEKIQEKTQRGETIDALQRVMLSRKEQLELELEEARQKLKQEYEQEAYANDMIPMEGMAPMTQMQLEMQYGWISPANCASPTAAAFLMPPMEDPFGVCQPCVYMQEPWMEAGPQTPQTPFPYQYAMPAVEYQDYQDGGQDSWPDSSSYSTKSSKRWNDKKQWKDDEDDSGEWELCWSFTNRGFCSKGANCPWKHEDKKVPQELVRTPTDDDNYDEPLSPEEIDELQESIDRLDNDGIELLMSFLAGDLQDDESNEEVLLDLNALSPGRQRELLQLVSSK